MTLFSSRSVCLLGGEPTLHPQFERVVGRIAEHGLGPILFTNGSRPDKVAAVAHQLWSITVNGHFASRAPKLGFDVRRIFANLPVRPGDDVLSALQGIRDAGIRGMFLAFSTPVGGADSNCFTPEDQDGMPAVLSAAMSAVSMEAIWLVVSAAICRVAKAANCPVVNAAI